MSIFERIFNRLADGDRQAAKKPEAVVSFKAAIPAPDGKGCPNPGRGWYQVYSFDISEEINENDLVWSLDENDRLAMLLIDIGCCRERPLSEKELENAARIFEFFSSHKKEMIIRPVYDREGRGLEKEPPFLSIVLGHIKQLGAVISRYKDNICAVQGLFVGSWGEMHTSKFLSKQKMAELMRAMRSAVGSEIFLAVRTPLQRRLLKRSAVDVSRIGLFNDGMFGSETHLGTFGGDDTASSPETAWTAVRELEYFDRECRFTPNGGEAVLGEECSAEVVIDAMRQMHVTYLNRVYDNRILEKWKNTPTAAGISLYEVIGARLGYMFVVESVSAEENGDELVFSVSVRNDGFASLMKRAEISLEINTMGAPVIAAAISGESGDLRQLSCGESLVVTRGFTRQESKGSYSELYLVIKHENGEFIRTANSPDKDRTLLGVISGWRFESASG